MTERTYQMALDAIGCNPNDPAERIAQRTQDYFEKIDAKHTTGLYNTLVVVLALRYSYEDKREWKNLCKSDYWSHRLKRNRPSLEDDSTDKSKFAALRVCAGRNEVRYDRAWKYGRLIGVYFDRGITPDQLIDELVQDGGFEEALRKATQESPLRKWQGDVRVEARIPDDTRDKSDEVELEIDDDAQNNNDNISDDTAKTSEPRTSKNSNPKDPAISLRSQLAIGMSDAYLADAFSIPVGGKALVLFERIQDDNRFKKYKALSILTTVRRNT